MWGRCDAYFECMFYAYKTNYIENTLNDLNDGAENSEHIYCIQLSYYILIIITRDISLRQLS